MVLAKSFYITKKINALVDVYKRQADFSAYYKDKQLYFSKRNIRLNGISQIVEQVDIGGVYPMLSLIHI